VKTIKGNKHNRASLPSDYGGIYQQKCIACHGSDGTAGIANAANLQKSVLDSVSVIKVISEGKNGMPSFSSQLTREEIRKLSRYVRSLRK